MNPLTAPPTVDIRYQTLNWHAYHDVLDLILTGKFGPGARLDEQLIAEALGISRTPLREAIAKLVKDGLVEHRPYRGNFVRSYTARQAGNIYEVRKSLESLAVRAAIPNLTDEAIGRLRAILTEVSAALAEGDLVRYSLLDQQFHDLIAALSGNETLIAMLSQLRGQIQLIRLMANRDPDLVETTAAERPEILDAMAARDTERAARLMAEHIELVRRHVMRRLGEGEAERADEATADNRTP